MKLVLPLVMLIVACLVTAAVAERQTEAYSENALLVSEDDCVEQQAYGLLEHPTRSKLTEFCAYYSDLNRRED